ncbi:hypothetical protein ATANTOWER_028195 [Ataeniobius toweri]|uniref:Uncharacterized protein n=1 Tax=Ataeniobius toweri TaxID=208326 RepID=A0ABU7ABT6_9TELE|nr:hypothetical protein [Ataeniobius toweri]
MTMLTVGFRNLCGPTLADDMANQHSLSTDITLDSVPFHSFSKLWHFDFQMKYNLFFHLKRGLWTTNVQSSSLSPYHWYVLLWLTLLVEDVNDCFLDICAVSSLPYDCVAY